MVVELAIPVAGDLRREETLTDRVVEAKALATPMLLGLPLRNNPQVSGKIRRIQITSNSEMVRKLSYLFKFRRP